MQAKANTTENIQPADDTGDDRFALGERVINYIRWPLLGIFLLFNNLGFTENRAYIWPINGLLVLALLMTGYIQYRLHRGYSFGKTVTFVLAVIQDSLITLGIYLTGLYDSHFFIFFYPSLLGFSLAFPVSTSLVYTSLVGLIYVGLCYFLTPGLRGELLPIKILVERMLVMYVIVIIGNFVMRQERQRRLEAVAAERRMAEKNEQLVLSLNKQMENWQTIGEVNDLTSEQLATLAQDLVKLADEMGTGAKEIVAATNEITGRAMTLVDQVAAIGRVSDQVVTAAHDLAASAGPTGSASRQAQRALAQAIESVESLNQRSYAIGERSADVRRVADQTNLLAFNASIEAIQAGQKGQRFAVVAGEVRQVAERAVHLAREIDDLSAEMQQGTRRVLNAISEIAEMVDQTVDLVQVTSEASQNQQASAGVMAQSIDTLETVSRQNVADIQSVANTVQQQQLALERITTLSQELAGSAGDLRSLTETIGG